MRCSGPRLVEDAVVSVLSVLSPTRVELTWKSSEDKSVIGYHVERAAAEVFSEDQLVRLKKQTLPLVEPSVGALRRIGPFARVTTAPIKGTTFIDTNIDLTKPQSLTGETVYERKFNREQFDESGRPYRFGVFVYRIRAVNAAGESGPSPAFFTIPSAPQWLFSKEDFRTISRGVAISGPPHETPLARSSNARDRFLVNARRWSRGSSIQGQRTLRG